MAPDFPDSPWPNDKAFERADDETLRKTFLLWPFALVRNQVVVIEEHPVCPMWAMYQDAGMPEERYALSYTTARQATLIWRRLTCAMMSDSPEERMYAGVEVLPKPMPAGEIAWAKLKSRRYQDVIDFLRWLLRSGHIHLPRGVSADDYVIHANPE